MKFVQGGHVGVFHPAFLALSFYRTIPSRSCFLAQPRTRDQHSGNVSLTSGSPQSHSSPSSTYPFPHFRPPKDCVTSGRLKRHIPMPFSRLASRSFLLQLLNTMGNGNLQGRARTSVVRALRGLSHPSRAAVRGTHGRHLPGWPLLVSVNKGLSGVKWGTFDYTLRSSPAQFQHHWWGSALSKKKWPLDGFQINNLRLCLITDIINSSVWNDIMESECLGSVACNMNAIYVHIGKYKDEKSTFKSLSHFEFIFVYGVRECSNFIDRKGHHQKVYK